MADEPASQEELAESPVPDEPEQVETEPEVTEPQYMTPEQVAEVVSRETNEIKTWLGRRDKDLFNQIGSVIDERLTRKQETPEELSSKLLEDPVSTIKQIMTETQSQEAAITQHHNSQTFTHLGHMMDSDPLYQDKDLGNELVQEVKRQFQEGNINRTLPPESAARVLHAEALANVLRSRKKATPLQNNPGKVAGTLTPGVPSTKNTLKTPNLSPETKKWAEKWGYSDEDLAKLYGSGN